MYFKEYILPLWYFSFSIMFLLFSIYSFLYRILVARKFQDKRRIVERDFRCLYSFISGLVLITISIQNRNNINIFLAIILIGLGFYLYDYNFILNEGLFIKGRLISWNKIKGLDYKKNNKEIVLSYFKKNNSKISKVTFTIRYDSRLALENMLKDKLNNTNINNVEKEDKIYPIKSIKIGVSLVLISLTMIFVYGVYNLLQPKALGEVLEKTFNHRETSSIVVRYEGELKDKGLSVYDMAVTGKEENIKEIKNSLNSFQIRKIQLEDLRYNSITEYPYIIEFYKLDGDKVEIFISKKEPIIEIVRNNKKRSYFIEKGYEDLEFVNKLGKSIE